MNLDQLKLYYFFNENESAHGIIHPEALEDGISDVIINNPEQIHLGFIINDEDEAHYFVTLPEISFKAFPAKRNAWLKIHSLTH